MQRTWTDRRRKITFVLIALCVFVILLGLDQATKIYLKKLNDSGTFTPITVIPNFLYISYTTNSGAAWSFLADKPWAQLFFKILTAVALCLFILAYVFVAKKGYKTLNIALILIIAGTIGNFIDRLAYNFVVDFISFRFGSYNFPIFNIADSCMTVGIVIVIVHFFFLDDNALFRRKKEDKVEQDS